ncbi:hypothetical protein P886_0905 [Alteromonadaceae bacterium 2753L.S.0a.02]|nr:hypothetical protein P886_0905 [Alteromonadaceae bacterium 2753L.S.0a.02]
MLLVLSAPLEPLEEELLLELELLEELELELFEELEFELLEELELELLLASSGGERLLEAPPPQATKKLATKTTNARCSMGNLHFKTSV